MSFLFIHIILLTMKNEKNENRVLCKVNCIIHIVVADMAALAEEIVLVVYSSCEDVVYMLCT